MRAFQMGQQLQMPMEASTITANVSTAGDLFLGVFDQNYQIQLIAEAVPVESCQNNTVSEYKRVSAI